MGQGMSDQERDVFELMTKLLQQHGKSLPSHDLNILLKWAPVKLPGDTESTVFTIDLWDKMGAKLWDLAVKGSRQNSCRNAPFLAGHFLNPDRPRKIPC